MKQVKIISSLTPAQVGNIEVEVLELTANSSVRIHILNRFTTIPLIVDANPILINGTTRYIVPMQYVVDPGLTVLMFDNNAVYDAAIVDTVQATALEAM